MSRRTHSYNAFSAQLASPISAGSDSITLTSTAGLTADCYLVIEPDSLTKREYVKVLAITTPTLENVARGLAGSVAGAQAHDSGVEVRAVMTHQALDDIFLDILEVEAEFDDHHGGRDTADHPEAETTARGFMSAADKSKLDLLSSPDIATGNLGQTAVTLTNVGQWYDLDDFVWTRPVGWSSAWVSVQVQIDINTTYAGFSAIYGASAGVYNGSTYPIILTTPYPPYGSIPPLYKAVLTFSELVSSSSRTYTLRARQDNAGGTMFAWAYGKYHVLASKVS